jgi:hypothetical protein
MFKYLKLKEQFTVDEEGQDLSQSALESENLLMEFVNFIKTSKIVVLEDLAAEFKLRTQVINLILFKKKTSMHINFINFDGIFY